MADLISTEDYDCENHVDEQPSPHIPEDEALVKLVAARPEELQAYKNLIELDQKTDPIDQDLRRLLEGTPFEKLLESEENRKQRILSSIDYWLEQLAGKLGVIYVPFAEIPMLEIDFEIIENRNEASDDPFSMSEEEFARAAALVHRFRDSNKKITVPTEELPDALAEEK